MILALATVGLPFFNLTFSDRMADRVIGFTLQPAPPSQRPALSATTPLTRQERTSRLLLASTAISFPRPACASLRVQPGSSGTATRPSAMVRLALLFPTNVETSSDISSLSSKSAVVVAQPAKAIHPTARAARRASPPWTDPAFLPAMQTRLRATVPAPPATEIAPPAAERCVPSRPIQK